MSHVITLVKDGFPLYPGTCRASWHRRAVGTGACYVFFCCTRQQNLIQAFKSAGPDCAACVWHDVTLAWHHCLYCHIILFSRGSYLPSISSPGCLSLSWPCWSRVKPPMWWPSEIEAGCTEHLASKRRRGRIYGKWVFLRTFRSGQKNPQVPGKTHVGWSFSILRHVPVCGDYKELSRGLLWSSRLSSFLLAEEINWLILLDRDMKPPCEPLGVVQVGTWE